MATHDHDYKGTDALRSQDPPALRGREPGPSALIPVSVPAAVLRLQGLVGNRATTALLQRGPPPAAPQPPAAGGGIPTGKTTRGRASEVTETVYGSLHSGGLTAEKIEAVLKTLIEHRDQADEVRRLYKEEHDLELDADLERLGPANGLRARDYLAHGKLRTMSKLLIALDGIGTDAPTVYRVLADAHKEGDWNGEWAKVVGEPRNTLAASFRGESLEEALDGDFDGADLVKALAIVNHGELRAIDRVFIAMDEAGTDEALLFEGLAGCDDATIERDFDAYAYRKHSALAIGKSIFHVLSDELSGEDYKRALALIGYEADPDKWLPGATDVRKLRTSKLVAIVKAATSGAGTNTQLIWDAVGKASDAEKDELRAKVQDPADPLELAGFFGDLNASEMARLRAMLGIREPADAAGLESTRDRSLLDDPAVRLLRSMGGVDKSSTFDTLRLTAGASWALFKSGYQTKDSPFRIYLTDNCTTEEDRALPVILGGTVRERMAWAIRGAVSDDEDYLFHVVKNFATDEERRSIGADAPFMNRFRGVLTSTEFAKLTDLMRPGNETPEERARALGEAVRDGSSGTFDLFSSTGKAVQDENRELQAGIVTAGLDAKLTPEEQKQLAQAAGRTEAALKDYTAARDQFAETASMVVNIAIGVLATVGTGGAAGPIVAAQLARAAVAMALARVLAEKAIRGDRFDVFGSDGAVAFAAGATDGIMNVIGGAAARGLVTSAFDGVRVSAAQVARSTYASAGVRGVTQLTEGALSGGAGGLVQSIASDDTWKQGLGPGVEAALKSAAVGAGQGAAVSGALAVGGATVKGLGAEGGKGLGPDGAPGGPGVRAPDDWKAITQVLGDLDGKVAVVENAKLEGTTVRVRYGDGAGVRMEIGPAASALHIGRHVATARFLLKYEGILGSLVRLKEKILTLLRREPGYGTRGFEARAEVKKLQAILDELEGREKVIRGKLDGAGDAADPAAAQAQLDLLDKEMAGIREQLIRHEADVDSYKPGEGFVAAEDPNYRSAAPKDFPQQPVNPVKQADGTWAGMPATVGDRVVLVFPGGQKVWRNPLTREIVIESKLGPAPGRAGHEGTLPARGAYDDPRFEQALYELSHSQGQGTGFEAPYGIQLAPQVVNQRLQRYGIEEWLYKLRDEHLPRGSQVHIITRTAAVSGSRELASIGYRIDFTIDGKRSQLFGFDIVVEAPGPPPKVAVKDFWTMPTADHDLVDVVSRIDMTTAQRTIQTRIENGAPWENVSFSTAASPGPTAR